MSEPIRIELPTVFGMGSVNSYVFKEPEPVLIDCGENTEQNWEALEAALKKEGLQIPDIKKVYITHAHVDHMGMAGRLARETQAEIWVSDMVRPWAVDLEAQWSRRIETIQSLLKDLKPPGEGGDQISDAFSVHFDKVLTVWEPVPEEKVHTFPMKGFLPLGGKDWEVIHSPGHCINQTCFYHAESRQLMSADMLLSITPTPVIEMEDAPPYARERSLAIFIKSMKKYAEMDIKRVYPGHYEIFGDPTNLIEKQLRRIEMRKEATLMLIKEGKHNFVELLSAMYPQRMHSPAFAMMVGYLDLLEEEGRIRIVKDEWGSNCYLPN